MRLEFRPSQLRRMHKMRRRAGLKTALILTTALGLLAPPPVRAADQRPQVSALPNQAVGESMVSDVALQGAGDLTGHLVGQDGKFVARETVYLMRQGAVVASCQTDASGRFAFTGLAGGVYEVRWSQGMAACRLWAPQTAPPSAKVDLLVTANAMVVRGQTGVPSPGCSLLKGPLPWIAAGVVAVGLTWWDVVVAQKHRFERDHPSSS
jgi:hypothetical protein